MNCLKSNYLLFSLLWQSFWFFDLKDCLRQPNRGKFEMLNDKTSKVVLAGGILLIILGAFAPNWIVNQFMFGFARH